MGGGKCFKKSSLLEHITAIKKGGRGIKSPGKIIAHNSGSSRFYLLL